MHDIESSEEDWLMSNNDESHVRICYVASDVQKLSIDAGLLHVFIAKAIDLASCHTQPTQLLVGYDNVQFYQK